MRRSEAVFANRKEVGRGTRRKGGGKEGRRNRREKRAEAYEASEEETDGGKGDNAAGVHFCPEGGEIPNGTMSLKFGARITSGAASSAAFAFDDKAAEPSRTALISSAPEGKLQNQRKSYALL